MSGNNEAMAAKGIDYERDCKGIRYPHKMTFTDHNGDKHEIFMPLGSMERVNKLTIDKDWSTLLQEFPKYDGQTHDYTELDAEFNAKKAARLAARAEREAEAEAEVAAKPE